MPLAVRFDAVSTCSTGPNQSIQVKNAPVGRATSCVQNVSTPSGPSALASVMYQDISDTSHIRTSLTLTRSWVRVRGIGRC